MTARASGKSAKLCCQTHSSFKERKKRSITPFCPAAYEPPWVRRAETDGGLRPGLSITERERIKQLERENRELRRANEILKAPAVFFGTELDRNGKR